MFSLVLESAASLARPRRRRGRSRARLRMRYGDGRRVDLRRNPLPENILCGGRGRGHESDLRRWLRLSGDRRGRKTHTEIVDGKVHMLWRTALRYAVFLQPQNRDPRGYKIYRRAARDDTTGRVLIGDYIVPEDGRMLIGLFGNGKMEGYDVKNSSRPSEPDRIVECIRCKESGLLRLCARGP